MVFGGYTHTIFNKASDIVDNKIDNTYQPCVQRTHQICTEHSKIDTKTDTIYELGTVKLNKSYEESFVKEDFIVFNNTKTIHLIDSFKPGTLTVNFLSDSGDREIDVFVSHKTPERTVLSKSDTCLPVEKKVSSNVIDRCLMILKSGIFK